MKCTRYSCPILMKLGFSLQIFEKYSNKIMKIHPLGAELFHTDVRTDIRPDVNLIVVFLNFAKTP
jgi:hypothetical protein